MELHTITPDEVRNRTDVELTREAYRDFRGMGYADLKALHGAINARMDRLEEHGDIDSPSSDDRERFRFLQWRSYAAGMLRRFMEERGRPPEWGELPPHLRRKFSAEGRLGEYLDEITEVLEKNPPGSFGSKTAIYRAVDERMGQADGCRTYINRNMDEEPKDENEWREYLGV